MSRRDLARAVIVAGVVLGTAMAGVADEGPDCSGTLFVTPAHPDCADTVTLGAMVTLSDSCWLLDPPVFLDEPPDFALEFSLIDSYQPPFGCVYVVIDLPFTQVVGPLPYGPYAFEVTYSSTSPRFGDAVCTGRKTFDVTCCPELPPALTALRVTVGSAGTEIRLNWVDVPGADDYVVYGADGPDGTFTRPIETAASGAAGAGLPIADAPSYFLVAARNGCGVGPRR